MTIYNIIALLIGLLALIIAFVLLKKIALMVSKDKSTAKRVIENVAAGILAGIILLILQQYVASIGSLPPLDLKSGVLFFKSLGISLGNLFIMTSIMLAVVFFAVYKITKPLVKP